MREYETVIIWTTNVPESETNGEHDRVVEIIEKEGGTYGNTERWTRRILAYPIRKQTEGIYHFLRWSGENNVIDAIDKYLKINENCLRFVTLRNENHGTGAQTDFGDVEETEEDSSMAEG